MARPIKLLLLLLVAILASQSEGAIPDTVSRRHDYKHAIKKPIVFGEGILPHFVVSGDVMTSHEWLRIVPSVQSKKGGVWSSQAVSYANWEVVMSFLVSGRGRLGGDGMALWLTKEHLQQGEAMGAQEQWDGLMLFFDTYDNDNKRNNPYVGAILNDGTLRFSPDTDGSDLVFNGCQRNFRNTPVPVFVRITYYHGTLSVAMDTHGRGKNFLDCFEQQGVQIPQGYYFGVTAATGALADDHDLLSFELYELDPSPRKAPEAKQPTGNQQNVNQEQFEKIQEKVQEIRAKYETPFELEEKYELFLGKLSNMEELLSGLAMISNNQEQIRQTISNALILMERIMSAAPQQAGSNPGAQQDHNNPNINSQQLNTQLSTVLTKLTELQQEVAASARPPHQREGSGPTSSLLESVASMETTVRQIQARLARLENSHQHSPQLAQIIRDELARIQNPPVSSSYGSGRRDTIQTEEESSNLPLILTVVLVAVLGLGAGAYFVANRKASPKKFI